MYADVAYINPSVDAAEGQSSAFLFESLGTDLPIVIQESVLPDVIPNTLEDEDSVVATGVPISHTHASAPVPDPERASRPNVGEEAEPGVPQPTRRKLPRRAASRAPSRGLSPSPTPASQSTKDGAVEEIAQEAPPRELEQPRKVS